MDDLGLPRQAIAAGDEVVHERVGTILRAARDCRQAAMAELVDVVLDRPVHARFAHEVGPDFGGDDLVGPAASAVARTVPSKLTIMPSPIESKVPSEPHMQTLAVTMRLRKRWPGW